MSNILTIGQTAEWLDGRDNFLLITHRRPDGDTVGSAGALARGLMGSGKTAYVMHNPEITPRYLRFVEELWAPEDYVPEHLIAVDLATPGMFPLGSSDHTGKIALCIDHHPSNSLFADHTCLEGGYSSCGEIVYELLLMISGGMSAKSAECLYVAVSTDTGCFAFANTTANTFRVAARLIEYGAPHTILNKLLFRTKTAGRIKIEGMIYTGLEFFYCGAVAVSTITLSMMESAGADEDDVDDIASIPGSVEGVLAGVTIRELAPPRGCKVSIRTGPAVNAHSICERFGGGGHPMAAGCSFEGPVEEIKRKLLVALGDYLP